MPNYITDDSILSKLNGPDAASPAPARAASTASPSEFASTYGPAASRAAEKIGVDPSVLLGQWGLETGWGKSVIPGTNNLGNIKDFSGAGVGATDNTTGSHDNYRSFGSPDEFADHYADLIQRKYPNAVGSGADSGKFATALATGGYAEDPNYASRVQAAARTVSPFVRAANAVTNAIIPSANAAQPEAQTPAQTAPGKQYVQDPALLQSLNAPAPQASFMDRAKDALVSSAQAVINPIGAMTGQAPKTNATPTREDVAADAVRMGLRDPLDSLAQMAVHALPASVVDAGNSVNNWLADKTGLVGKLPERNLSSLVTGGPVGIDKQIQDNEQAYQSERAAVGSSGFDPMRTIANVANPINLIPATRVAGLVEKAPTIARVAASALTGALSSTGQPVTNGGGSYWRDKGIQAAEGAAGGLVTYPVASTIARLVSPKASANAELDLLKSEGVQPTIGQTLGGAWNNLEEKAQSIPILGDMIGRARGIARDQFNTAAINRATEPIGATVKGAGQDAIKSAGDQLSAAYDAALNRVQGVPLDTQFQTQLGQLRQMAQGLVPTLARKFDDTVNNIVLGRAGPQNVLLGPTYKAVDSELGQIASRYGKSSLASEQEFGDAVAQLQNLMKQQMVRTNPQVAGDLAAADQGWANLVRVERAAKAAQNTGGVFTPAQLNAAVRGSDDSVRGRAIARGEGLMQDLGNAGQKVLGNKVPDSGTAGRVLTNVAALASAALHPAIPVGLGIGGLAYTGPIQSALRAAVSSRPQVAQPIAKTIRDAAPLLGGGGGALALELGKQ